MTAHISKEPAARMDWRAFAIVNDAMPPRDPDDDEEDEEEENEDEDDTDEPPVVREPDED
jgi:hypothetical protein